MQPAPRGLMSLQFRAAAPRALLVSSHDRGGRHHAASEHPTPRFRRGCRPTPASGKTYVLAQRVIRLLLDGTHPSKMLCLTYTKAAAANMANRVFERLARLDHARRPRARRANPRDRREADQCGAPRARTQAVRRGSGDARRAEGADHPRVLHPAPATVPVRGRRRGALPGAGRDPAETDAGGHPHERPARRRCGARQRGGPRARDHHHAGQRFRVPAGAAGSDPRAPPGDRLARYAGGVEGAMAELSQSLGIEPEDTVEKRRAGSVRRPAHRRVRMAGTVAILATRLARPTSEQCRATDACAHRQRGGTPCALLAVFCTADGSARASIVTKRIANKHPGPLPTLHRRAKTRLHAARPPSRRHQPDPHRRAADARRRASSCAIGPRRKRAACSTTTTSSPRPATCSTSVSAAWVHYKLDLGIDHLLIDEAQDTSPEQWDIIERLVAEFAAGAGARGTIRRSIFAVGDDKQSIYSFQGADPAEFHDRQRSFEREFKAAEMEWRNVRLDYSFRSNDSVLAAVQQVFRDGSHLSQRDQGRSRHFSASGAARRSARLRRAVADREAGRARAGRALGFAVRQVLGDEPARQAGAADRQGGAALDRSQGARRHRRRAPRRAAGRHSRARAPARAAVRGDHPRTEEREHRRRGRRPAGADRPYRRDGPAGAGRRAAVAGRRPRARDRAQEPAVRPDGRRAVQRGVGPHRHAASRIVRTPTRACRRVSTRWRTMRNGSRRSRSTRLCSARTRAASASSSGSASKPTTCSTNSSISH